MRSFFKNNIIYRLKLLKKMKKVLLFVALVATIGFASCTNKQAEAEKARQDSLKEVARLDSIAAVEKARVDSIAAAAAAAADTLVQTVEQAAATVK